MDKFEKFEVCKDRDFSVQKSGLSYFFSPKTEKKKKRRKCTAENSIVGSGFEPMKENETPFRYFITSLDSADTCKYYENVFEHMIMIPVNCWHKPWSEKGLLISQQFIFSYSCFYF